MEANEKNYPSLPPNYVSLADLQHRWMKQQQEKKSRQMEKSESQLPNSGTLDRFAVDDVKKQDKRKEKEKFEPQRAQIGVEDVKEKSQFRKLYPSITDSNPNVYNRGPVRRNNRDRKGPKEYRGVKSNPESRPSKVEAVIEAEIDGVDQVSSDRVDNEQTSKAEGKKKRKKTNMNKKKKQNPTTEERKPASNGECGEERENEVKGGVEAPSKSATSDRTVEIGEKTKDRKKKQTPVPEEQKPARNGDCSEDRENEGGEAPLKLVRGDLTAEIEEKLQKVSVNGRCWRSNGRSTAVKEGSRGSYSGYGRGERRRMGRSTTKERKPASNGECGEERENEVKGGGEAPSKSATSDQTVEIVEKTKDRKKKQTPVPEEQKPARNSDCIEDRENEGGEAPLKLVRGDQTAEIEEKLQKVFVNGRGWRSNGRSTAVMEGSRGWYWGYGRGERSGMGRMRRENGLVWVKGGGEAPSKSATSDRTVEIGEKTKGRKKKQTQVPEEQKPARNGDCSEDRDNEDGEAPLKLVRGDQTAEIEEKLQKVSVNGRGWRSTGRSTAVMEGSRGSNCGYGRGERIGMGRMRRENGLVWVKKGEVPEHTQVK